MLTLWTLQEAQECPDQECPLCHRTFQRRHFRLLSSGGEGREHICTGCSQKHKTLKALIEEGLTEHQCVPQIAHCHTAILACL